MHNIYFPTVDKIEYKPDAPKDSMSYKFYDSDRVIFGKKMSEHLRVAVCYWHNFCWRGEDAFGQPTRKLTWNSSNNPMDNAFNKADAVFEFVKKLGLSYFTFHDIDVAPEGDNIREFTNNFKRIVDYFEEKMSKNDIKLLWGTANLFTNPRYHAGAATNPSPYVFSYAATQVKYALEATHKLKGSNYVLWGGREGYDTILNTDLKKEKGNLAKFLSLVVDHKYKIGFQGELLLEPKPCEPTKHQYDYDTETVLSFLSCYGLEKEFKVNIEANHATLSGHSFEHEIATAASLNMLGSIDANRGDPQNGWDTDQFPNSIEEMTLVMYYLLKSGGFSKGGFNFDAKVRRQSNHLEDMFYGHIGGIDVLAKSLINASQMISEGLVHKMLSERYSSWTSGIGKEIINNEHSLDSLAKYVHKNMPSVVPTSGKQELYENIITRFIHK